MPLTLYNSRTKKKELFLPLTPNQVKMYVCGVTVYDDCHLGHARSALVFDTIRRYLEYSGYQVTYVRNFTDVDDKILQRAHKEGIPWTQVTEKYIEAFYRDMGRLGIIPPTIEPRATHHIQDIVDMIAGLVEKDVAYEVEGDVYFEVRKFSQYGQLSGRNLEELLAGARVEVDHRKKDPMDFALWKSAKPDEPGWESPWGKGRPGWHIECSAMSIKHLGPTFDIHGGGKDLIFPHHENEVAQSCAYTGKEFARYWIHNGFVTIDQEKMSKSLGNFFTIREIFEKSPYSEIVTGECLRYYLLSTHYRSDINFSNQSIAEAKAALDSVYGLIQRLEEEGTSNVASPVFVGDHDLNSLLEGLAQKSEEAMDDDFNTPKVLAAFHEFRGVVNKLLAKGLSHNTKQKVKEIFRKLGKPLGLFQISPDIWSGKLRVIETSEEIPAKFSESLEITPLDESEFIEKQVRLRNEARAQKDFSTADTIRNELAEQGIILEDRPDGTTRWKR
ncbi:cysteine--tRNA ligase [Candidatus Nitrospira neomarina]|uniref:Cysteine--tRNA ligase n=1 Tax=Candidatus Nitrospira neomarina TaxID=3020899 RepID=A0AA96K1M6_9BACT|nr:cysteine--tRNA ligase [Candidatus Nitrospira neomarina]WNM60824.1 cysteine--tRNA ligase [Candidatus Nitrospira neomarina]